MPPIEFTGQFLQSVGAAGSQHEMHATRGELARELRADSRRSAGHHGPPIRQ
jgi:hypothetical protein